MTFNTKIGFFTDIKYYHWNGSGKDAERLKQFIINVFPNFDIETFLYDQDIEIVYFEIEGIKQAIMRDSYLVIINTGFKLVHITMHSSSFNNIFGRINLTFENLNRLIEQLDSRNKDFIEDALHQIASLQKIKENDDEN